MVYFCDHLKEMEEKALQMNNQSGKLTIKDGMYVCPVCRQKTNQAASSDTQAMNLRLWCRHCKTVHIVNIISGQCSIVSRCR